MGEQDGIVSTSSTLIANEETSATDAQENRKDQTEDPGERAFRIV